MTVLYWIGIPNLNAHRRRGQTGTFVNPANPLSKRDMALKTWDSQSKSTPFLIEDVDQDISILALPAIAIQIWPKSGSCFR